MASKKRLIEELREMADRTPPICHYDKPYNTEIFGKQITVYCKPFEQFQELLRRAADALSVDAVEVNRLGKLGRLMMPYKGDPRGHMGARGCSGEDFRAIELDPITDVDGNRWVPVLEQDLFAMKARADDTVKVVRCKDCKNRYTMSSGHSFCRVNFPFGKYDDDFCSYGERKDNG